MAVFTLDCQVISQGCPHCKAEFTVVRGSFYDEGAPFGLYLVALHRCDGTPLGHVALAVLDEAAPLPQAVALQIWPTPNEFQMSLTNWEDSPWRTENYLGNMMDREEAKASPLL